MSASFPCGAETVIFWVNKFNTMAADVQVPYITKSPTIMVFTM